MAGSELADLRKQCMASLYLCTENVLKYLDEEKESELAKLKNCVREYCSMEAMQNLEEDAFVMASRVTDVSNVNLLEDKYQTFLRDLQKQRFTEKKHIDNHPFMQEFDKRVRNAQLNNTQNLDESDLVITETQELFLDPLRMKPIEDPVRNTVCNHVYERATIHRHIQSRSRARCPVAGCGNPEPVQLACLVDDEVLRMRIQAAGNRQRSRLDLDDTDSQ